MNVLKNREDDAKKLLASIKMAYKTQRQMPCNADGWKIWIRRKYRGGPDDRG